MCVVMLLQIYQRQGLLEVGTVANPKPPESQSLSTPSRNFSSLAFLLTPPVPFCLPSHAFPTNPSCLASVLLLLLRHV